MAASNEEHTGATYYSMSAKTADGAQPGFLLNEKVGGKWEKTKSFNTVRGTLSDIEYSTYVFEKKLKHQVKLTLIDSHGGKDVVQCNFNQATYSILNSLAGSDISKELKISIDKKASDDGKKIFTQVFVNFGNNEKSTWKYDWKDVPKSVMVEIEGIEPVENAAPVIDFWRGVIEEIKPRIKAQSEIENEAFLSQTTDVTDGPSVVGGKNIFAKKNEARNEQRADEDYGLDLPFSQRSS